ncbi:MAG: hypothetical protein LBL04_08445 [Bacteroidales bacterium]|jgi:hypothetical protein|nr:hypothetical protein [Bacteroidales bacterium]
MNDLSKETGDAGKICTEKTNGGKMEKVRKTFVIIGGVNLLIWGLFHISFWFAPFPVDWKNELTKITELNSNVMQMLNIGIIVFLLSFGVMMLSCRREILTFASGRALLIIFALFWLARLTGEIVFPGGSVILGFILFLCVLIYLIPAIIIHKHE